MATKTVWIQDGDNSRYETIDVPDAAPAPAPAQVTNEQVAAIDRLAKQILAQNITDKWSGQGFGSAEANAKDMAKILDGIGITDIRQFGQFETTVNKQQKVVPEYRTIDVGDSTQSVPTGRYYIPAYSQVGDSEQLTGKQYVDPSSVKTSEVIEGDNSYTTYTASIPTKELAYGNKETGKVVPNTYSERQTGNAWGGTFAGSGNTGYRVQFAPDGTPVFYTTGASSSDLGDLMPIISVALMATGAGAGLGAALMGGSSVAATALGSGIISGVMAEATGGDFIKGAITGAVGAGVGAYAGDLGAALGVTNPDIAKAVGGAIIQGAASEAAGGDFIDGAIAGALSGSGQKAGELLGLTGQVASTVGTSIVKGVVAEVQGKDVTDAMIAGAVSGALSYKTPETTVQTAEEMDKTFQEDMAKLGITSTDLNIGPKTEDVLASSFQEDMTNLGIVSTEAPPPSEYQFTKDFGTGTDYSLTTGVTFPKEGINVDEVKDAGATVGESPVDYSLNVNAPFDGLQMPTSPNLDGMGGGQGLTVKTPDGVLSEEGVTKTGTASDLGDPDSFINKPAPDVPEDSLDWKAGLKTAMGLVGGATAGLAATKSTRTPSTPVNLNYGDIYKDAPIKGFAMRKGEDGKYTPYIGDKAQLAKGGLASRRK